MGRCKFWRRDRVENDPSNGVENDPFKNAVNDGCDSL